MKTLLAFAVLTIGLALPAAAQQARQDFVLVNRTSHDIDEVYISPGKVNDWQEDILGDEVLETDTQREIKFHRAGKTCIWDLKVVYSDDGEAVVWPDIDLCKISKITLFYNSNTEKTTAEFE